MLLLGLCGAIAAWLMLHEAWVIHCERREFRKWLAERRQAARDAG